MKNYLEVRKEELKKRGNKGFTLMEMLIVVAIIAVLIAIAIPVFTSQLDSARKATDDANARSAKALAVAEFMSKNPPAAVDEQAFDAAAGKLVAKGDAKAYKGQSSAYGNQELTVSTDASGNPSVKYGSTDWAG